MTNLNTSDDSVAARAGGSASGTGEQQPLGCFARVKSSVWGPLIGKALSVAVGMAGLATIGVVAGMPKLERVELMSFAPGESWLAGAALPSHAPSTALTVGPPGPGSPASATAAEEVADEPPAASGERNKPPVGITADGKVILNTADVGELTRLPGIGQKRAEKIVELRTRLKRFKKVTDLLRVKGIGPKSLRKMLPHLVLDAPELDPKAP